MRNNCYISGPITGYDLQERIEAFDKVQKELSKKGIFTINPLGKGYGENESYTHADYLREDIGFMVQSCNSIYLMDGWRESEGCKVEYQVAKACDFKIIEE